ncbi:hypothetical protein MYXA107069_25690 [Myxococcus xanthus]|nr:hypothetical protein MyxoNM_31980 [Myxococcus xanthus]SDY13583.1 hypothetical protein SAMN05444383_11982 [Myxococcus xanthus]
MSKYSKPGNDVMKLATGKLFCAIASNGSQALLYRNDTTFTLS